ncbi:hypothetical protein NP493_413g02087 [Ridgeia piscesae]|uniref:Uncharacterized protein n=1 Tax=Ridgeia piscesae TaxID=27915 RepID=A0AAD9L131_RIDPI|nr:hypothetical protein NP493_413g02087 [Ridgeia piscesae]
MGAYVPQCTDDGKYQKRQCHGSTGYCWCVNEDGAEVDGTRKGPSEGPVECEEGKYAKPTGPCHVALARTRPLLGAYVPQCTDDGKYQKRQCHGSTGYCWCVNEDGAEVDGTRKDAKPTGPCHVALARTRPLLGAYVPQCTDDGKYQKRQCHGSTGYCWCVNEDGAEVDGTRKGPSEGPVECEEEFYWRKRFSYCCRWRSHAYPYTAPFLGVYAGRPRVSDNPVSFLQVKHLKYKNNSTSSPSLPPVASGGCWEKSTRWYFDRETETCKHFHGCEGKDNNFDSKTACEFSCPPRGCPVVDCKLSCQFGYQLDANKCHLCRCMDDPCSVSRPKRVAFWTCIVPSSRNTLSAGGIFDDLIMVVNGQAGTRHVPSFCSLPAVAGPCRNHTMRWSHSSIGCTKFQYGGCGGNENNFRSEYDCYHTCRPVCGRGRCWLPCPFVYVKDDSGDCDTCSCVDPCSDVKCPAGQTCVARKVCNPSPCKIVTQCSRLETVIEKTDPACKESPNFGEGFAQYPRWYYSSVVRPELQSLCSLGFNAGLCSTAVQKWFYNVTSDKCQMRNFSSCRGNTNRFDDKTQCMTTCKPNACKPPACVTWCPFGLAEDENGCEICECFNPCKNVTCRENEKCLPERQACLKSPCPAVGKCFVTPSDLNRKCVLAIDVGRCSSRELKWFFNLTSSVCQAFNYTGCRGNPNRFNSKAECRQTCEPHRCEPPRCGEKCQFGSVKDVNGCDTCQCINPCKGVQCPANERCLPERRYCSKSPCPVVGRCFAKRPDLDSKCTMAQEAGICDSHELKWFFNVTSNRCEAFNYTGCRGNYNRFNSKDECRRTCEPHHCEPARCKEKCMFGSVKDINGCDTCHCINPCEDVKCAEGEHCVPEQVQCFTSPCPPIGKCYPNRPHVECKPNGCRIFCPFGRAKDDDGCDICQCINPCKVGLCGLREQKWFFNVTSNKCEAFNFTGCRSNGNNFESERACMKTSVRTDVPALCSVPADFGLCSNRTTRWYFDTEADTCVQFIYSGCRGNMNNFRSEADCVERCVPSSCPPISCDPPCVIEKDEKGCGMCSCGDPCKHLKCTGGAICDKNEGRCVMVKTVPEKCKLPPKTGRCRAYFRRWFYNVTSGACERFVYGGCQANANNFRKKEQCEEVCLPSPCPDVTKCPWCEHGLVTDDRGCTVCECSVNPCMVVDCADNTKCEVVKGNCSGPGCQTVAKCVPQNATKCPDVMCARYCEYGLERGPDGCRICRCSNPCKSVNCGSGFKCKVKLCSDSDPDCRPVGICVPWQLTTEIPTRRLVKPGLCPERAQMGAGICAEMCSFDVSLLNTTTPAQRTTVTVTTERPAFMSVKPGQCPVATGPGDCVDECSHDQMCPSTQKCCSNGCGHVCTDPGWLCPTTKDNRPCDVRNMCAAGPTCQWMPDAKCVDDHCKCRATFVSDFNQVVDCDTESTLCLRMRSRALARSKVVSDMWVPDCDESAMRTFTSMKAILWLNGIYETEVEDKEMFASVRTNETDHLSLVSKADRFERLVHAGKLRIINRGRLLPVDQRSERRFRFSFVYAEEPRTASSKEKLGRGVIIAITIPAFENPRYMSTDDLKEKL